MTLPPRPAGGAAVAPWAGVVRARRVGPHGQSRRRLVTALTGLMSDLPEAVWVCAAATDEDAAVVGEHDHQVFGVTLEPEPRPPSRHCKRARTGGLAQRTAALDRAQDVLAARERAAGQDD